ncbi:LacI family DNA-binding transcriptional regulator [Labrys monachus]|uniref:LacI family transcriptional regulator n=1 Tax=Labrys monachus TaxID=217067 RepID=A0ABU0FJ49_9HYPH|nr:LacI family DNA-binding transcriptional regulator [Labrys monachus]MDQ0394367.1 LacI family transcriptional regulator [Labrys monachus]
MAARLIDVARLAGLSVTAVSRHLNGRIKLPDDTVAMIEDAVRELGYQPNPHARSLSRGRSDTVGLVIPDIGNPYFAKLAASVEQAAHKRGLALLLCVTLNRRDREQEYLRRLATNYLDGLIFVTNHPNDGSLADLINQTNRRVVILDEDIEGARGAKIFSDNAQAGYLATKHLIEAGHRRIAILSGPEHMMSSRDRLAGCRKAVAESGVEAELTALLYGEYSPGHGRRAAQALLDRSDGTTALIFASDEIAIGAIELLQERGVRVPEDMSLIGGDDVAPFHLLSPPLTSIRLPVDAMGQRGMALLIAGLNKKSTKATVEHLPVELVIRRSVAAPRAAKPPGRA